MYSFVRHIKDKLLQVVRTKKICGYSSRKKIYHIAYITSNVLMNLINDMYETSSSKKRLLVVIMDYLFCLSILIISRQSSWSQI
jgi:hypothetical protein